MITTYVNGLTLKAEAEALRERISDEKEKNVVRLGSLNLRLKSFTNMKGSIAGGLGAIDTELTGARNSLVNYPEGSDAYDKTMDRIKRLEYEQYVLTSRDRDKGQDIIIDIAHEIEITEIIITKKDELLALLDAKIASFPA